MKIPTNKILLILMKDGGRYTYSVPKDNAVNKIYKLALQTDEINIQDVKEALFFPQTVYSLEDYQYYFDEETKKVDQKPAAIDFKIDEFRKQRTDLFKILDLEFMKALERDNCEDCKSRVVEIKKYLREVPVSIEEHLKDLEVNEIVEYNLFNNIFSIKVLNGGSGYTSSPKVTISAPDQTGTQMEGIAQINPESGRVELVHTSKVGSGYLRPPAVTIAQPEGPNGNTAVAVASSPENDIFNMNI